MTTSSVSPVTTELAGSETGITLVIHAGAGSRGKHSTPERIAQVELDLQRALDAGYQLLESGAPAHEAVVAAIHVMEDAPEFNAGRGAALTSDGIAQMDACLMTGDGEVGAVTGVSTVKNPIDAARAVKEQTKHVLFADPTDAEIADWGVATESNEYFITEQRRQSLAEAQSGGDEWEKHGTIGAVARDAEGNIAAGTSTGGIANQMHGRVGDSPLPGCGTFANQSTVAVSCVTRVAELGEPVTMALRMLATPGMVTVLSMLLTDMSSAHAYLSGKTFITKLVICASSKAVTAAEIWAR